MNKLSLRPLWVASLALCLALGSLAQAEDLPEPKKNPFSAQLPAQEPNGTSVTDLSVMINEQIQIELDSRLMGMPIGMGQMGMNGQLIGPGATSSLQQVLEGMALVGEFDGIHVYKDQSTGCYLNENYQQETASAIERRCYKRIAERLRDNPEDGASHSAGPGNQANQ